MMMCAALQEAGASLAAKRMAEPQPAQPEPEPSEEEADEEADSKPEPPGEIRRHCVVDYTILHLRHG